MIDNPLKIYTFMIALCIDAKIFYLSILLPLLFTIIMIIIKWFETIQNNWFEWFDPTGIIIWKIHLIQINIFCIIIEMINFRKIFRKNSYGHFYGFQRPTFTVHRQRLSLLWWRKDEKQIYWKVFFLHFIIKKNPLFFRK